MTDKTEENYRHEYQGIWSEQKRGEKTFALTHMDANYSRIH